MCKKDQEIIHQLRLRNIQLEQELQQFQDLYFQQKQYYQSLQDQFAFVESKYDESQQNIIDLKSQLDQYQDLNQSEELCLSLLQDLQGLEYLVDKMKQLIQNKSAISIIQQIQGTYDQMRKNDQKSNEYLNKLLVALDKKLNDIIFNNKENSNILQHSQTEKRMVGYLSQQRM